MDSTESINFQKCSRTNQCHHYLLDNNLIGLSETYIKEILNPSIENFNDALVTTAAMNSFYRQVHLIGSDTT